MPAEPEAEAAEESTEEISLKAAPKAYYDTAAEACKHEHTYTEKAWADDEVKYEDVNDEYHTVKGSGYIVTLCADCGEIISREETQIDLEAEHTFVNGACECCGHENSCAHEHLATDEYWNTDEVGYTKIDDEYHRVTGPGVKETWCEDCGEVFESIGIQINTEENHYYVDGMCIYCENTCKHNSTYYEYAYDPEECTIVDLKDGSHHKVTGAISKDKWCEYCDILLEEKDLGYTTVTEEHDYDYEDDCYKCYLCGYVESLDYDRVYGQTRYDTAIAAAERYKEATGSKFENVIVAYGQNFPDALSGGYLAKVKNAPILLVKDTEENRIADYISRNLSSGGTVYLLGGTGVVSSAFESKVKAKGIKTKRLGGATRYDTNLEILKEAGVTNQEILVCTGTGFADSLSASSAGRPILLVQNTLTEEQKSYIKGLSTEQFYLIGGPAVVKPAIEKGLRDLGYGKIDRLYGQDRYETSTVVAKKFFAKVATVVLAIGDKFPDGLSGGPLALIKDAPIVLATSSKTAAAKAYVKSAEVVRSITLGGPTLITDIAIRAIMGPGSGGSGD